MINELCQIFHHNRLIIDECELYKYTKQYFDFLISKFLYENGATSYQGIFDYIVSIYGSDTIKFSQFKKYIDGYLGEKDKGKFNLPENKQENIIISLSLIESSERKNVSLISKEECTSYILFINKLKDYLNINIRKNNIEIDFAQSVLYNLVCEFDNYYNFLKNNIPKINDAYSNMIINDIFKLNDVDTDILFKNQIITLDDLMNCSLYFILLVFSLQIPNLLNNINEWIKSTEDVINKVFIKIDSKALDILIKRNGYTTNKKHPLEEIGIEYGLTRERIRQIESKSLQKIIKNASKIEHILKAIFYNEANNQSKYVTKSQIVQKYGSDIANKILLLYEYGNLSIIYNPKYNIIYDNTIDNIEEMVNNIIEEIGVVADYYETKDADEFLQSILENHYKKIDDNLYIKNGFRTRELYLDIADEYFPNGYRVGEDEDYNKLVEIAKDKYKIDEEIPSRHSIEAMVGRSDFIQVDRGTYLPGKYCVELPEQLVDKILNYISENNLVYYRSIYEKFSRELSELGIDNHYYLKGCIDKKLSDDMVSKRDYIVNGNQDISPVDELVNLMKSFDYEFTLNDLKLKFPGIKDYTLYSVLYNEIDNGLVFISSYEFIYLSKLNINDNTKTELKEFVDNQFSLLNSNLISSKKIYARLLLTNKDLYKKLNLKNGHFQLFSMMKILYPNFYYHRPFISTEDTTVNTNYNVIRNHIEKYEKFNIKTVHDYQRKMNITGIYNYLQFMEDMSDDYVQIDISTMLKKDKLDISSSELENIKKSVDLILNNFGIINTENFKGYSLLPKIKYGWNKYLLIGILRTFYSDDYEIINTGNKYSNTDFEVRRLNHV
ncbi:MAG: hypothetical protein J6D28_03175 [Bacilli bacterium]|nr:hypothetical protein [Bacilli bacterium]